MPQIDFSFYIPNFFITLGFFAIFHLASRFLLINPFLEITKKRKDIIEENLSRAREYIESAKMINTEIREIKSNLHKKKLEIFNLKNRETQDFKKEKLLFLKNEIELCSKKNHEDIEKKMDCLQDEFLKNIVKISSSIRKKIDIEVPNYNHFSEDLSGFKESFLNRK